jgi:hypothetical protein
MEQGGLALLRAWESFCVIVGPSAAVLIGLQFVVIVLSAEINTIGNDEVLGAFGTPTIVHLCIVLLVSAIMTAPWSGLAGVAIAFDACGIVGLGYTAMVIRRARRQTSYAPVLEDWIWHCWLPLLAYAVLLVASLILPSSPVPALFVISAMMVLLLFIGIHNAWDSVIYIVARRRTEYLKEHE